MKGSGSPYRDGPGHEPDKVIYSLDKMENYLLNLNNIDGKSKAKFLKDVLGYASGDGEMLHNELLKSIKGQDASNVTVTEYGVKYEYDVKLGGKNGNSAKVKNHPLLERNVLLRTRASTFCPIISEAFALYGAALAVPRFL